MKLIMIYYETGLPVKRDMIAESNFFPSVGDVVYSDGSRFSVVNRVYIPKENKIIVFLENSMPNTNNETIK